MNVFLNKFQYYFIPFLYDTRILFSYLAAIGAEPYLSRIVSMIFTDEKWATYRVIEARPRTPATQLNTIAT
jgi:hypothetical protein